MVTARACLTQIRTTPLSRNNLSGSVLAPHHLVCGARCRRHQLRVHAAKLLTEPFLHKITAWRGCGHKVKANVTSALRERSVNKRSNVYLRMIPACAHAQTYIFCCRLPSISASPMVVWRDYLCLCSSVSGHCDHVELQAHREKCVPQKSHPHP